MSQTEIAGQLNATERELLTRAVTDSVSRPRVVLEVGTWLGGGSTVHLLRALESNGSGHLWGIEADRAIYERMLVNLRIAIPEALYRFTPLFGLSDKVIPNWLEELGPAAEVDVVFLDGGDNPWEQVAEFQLLEGHVPIGGQLLSHDAKLRKGKWLVPYLSAWDNWETELHDVSQEGLLCARKIGREPSAASAAAAAKVLKQLRGNLVERLGTALPSDVNSFLLRFLPTKLKRRVTQGRR